jgi:hypothetical protein
MVQYHY